MEVFFNVQPSTTACTRSEAAGSHGSGVRTEPSLSAAAPQRGQTDRQTDRPTHQSQQGLGAGMWASTYPEGLIPHGAGMGGEEAGQEQPRAPSCQSLQAGC